MDMPKCVAVDFDGTLDHGVYPDVFALDEFALSVLSEYQARGGKVILWTVRCGVPLDLAIAALADHGFKPDVVNDNLPGAEIWLDRCGADELSRKVYADVYIDDRATVDGVVDWSKWAQRLLSE